LKCFGHKAFGREAGAAGCRSRWAIGHPNALWHAAKQGQGAEFREWPVDFGGSGYVAMYRLDGDRAVILAVRHQTEAGYQPDAAQGSRQVQAPAPRAA
jgi:hypothetical protein